LKAKAKKKHWVEAFREHVITSIGRRTADANGLRISEEKENRGESIRSRGAERKDRTVDVTSRG